MLKIKYLIVIQIFFFQIMKFDSASAKVAESDLAAIILRFLLYNYCATSLYNQRSNQRF